MFKLFDIFKKKPEQPKPAALLQKLQKVKDEISALYRIMQDSNGLFILQQKENGSWYEVDTSDSLEYLRVLRSTLVSRFVDEYEQSIKKKTLTFIE